MTRYRAEGLHVRIADERLQNQRISSTGCRRPGDVVAWFGAVQAQEYEAAKWGLGLRMRDAARNAEIERAFDQGRILRTHVMRPTWHFVAPSDIRWLLELTAPRVQRLMAPYSRRLELDTRILVRGTEILARSLRDRQYLTRMELSDRLRRARLLMTGERLAHLVMHAELEGVVCSGPRRGKQFTYALVSERAPTARRMSRDEAIAELTERYVRGHGPATVRDFVWWSGLPTADAKRGLDMIGARSEDVEGRTYWRLDPRPSDRRREKLVHLLPIYDEYLVAYRDRAAVPHGPSVITATSRAVTFQHALVIAGQIAGTWRVVRSSRALAIEAIPLRRLTGAERRGLADAVDRYQRFQDVPVALTV